MIGFIKKISLTETKPYAKSLIVLGLLSTVLVIFLIIRTLTSGKSQEAITYQPTSPPYSGKQLPQAEGFDEELAKIKPSLPYSGNGFVIEYLQANLVIIKISSTTKEAYLTAKKQAEDYLRLKGVNDLCILRIYWVSEDDKVRKELSAQELYTSGCSRN